MSFLAVVEFNISLQRVYERNEQPYERSLSGTRLAHNGSAAVWWKIKREFVENEAFALLVSEGYIIEAHTGCLVEHYRIALLLNGDVLEFIETLGSRE